MIVAVADGKLIGPAEIKDAMFAEEAMGQTIAVEPTEGVIGSPANGTVEMVFETGHAFSVRMADDTVVLIHIGIDTVNLKGEGFRVLKKEGDAVKAGDPVVIADLKAIEKAGYSTQTMIVISEREDEDAKTDYIDLGCTVKRGQKITK